MRALTAHNHSQPLRTMPHSMHGRVDIGITGQDIVAEKQVKVDELLQLGYGKCKLCVQAPIKSTITDVGQLAGR